MAKDFERTLLCEEEGLVEAKLHGESKVF